jgi:hypothetical protein
MSLIVAVGPCPCLNTTGLDLSRKGLTGVEPKSHTEIAPCREVGAPDEYTVYDIQPSLFHGVGIAL